MNNVLQFTQAEWCKKQYTNHYSRGAWEFGGRNYPEEWIGRRNTLELSSAGTCLTAEGVHFEIVGKHEWVAENLVIPNDSLEFEDEDGSVVSVYFETWFDVDEKFGAHVHDTDDWVNLYAVLNLQENLLTMKYCIDKDDAPSEEFPYIPTTKERELVIRLIREAMERDGI